MKGRAGDLCSLTLDSGWVMEGEAGHRLRFVAAHSSHEAAMNGAQVHHSGRTDGWKEWAPSFRVERVGGLRPPTRVLGWQSSRFWRLKRR